MIHKDASEKNIIRVGMISTVVILVISIILARYIEKLGGSLFVYIQTLYAFFAPPFAAIFLLGILFRRINAKGATVAVFSGFAFGILLKLYIQFAPSHYTWLEPYANQAMLNWVLCVLICVTVSFLTKPPRPEQVTDQTTINWKKLNILQGLGSKWYNHILLWWSVFALLIIALLVLFSGQFL
jgi:SSS family solute:Na+ symporter